MDRYVERSVEADIGDVMEAGETFYWALLVEMFRGRFSHSFEPCSVSLIMTSTRQMAASRGVQ